VGYRRQKFTFAISSPDEFLSVVFGSVRVRWCDRLSWMPASFWNHVNTGLCYPILILTLTISKCWYLANNAVCHKLLVSAHLRSI